MVIAGVLQAVAEVGIGADIPRAWVTAAQDLDVEMVVGRRRDVGELLVGIVPFGDHAEVERSTYQRLAVSRSGVRTATWWPRISAKGDALLCAGGTKSAMVMLLVRRDKPARCSE